MNLHRRALVLTSAAALSTPIWRRGSAGAQDATPAPEAASTLTIYLLTIRGTLATPSLEDARTLHNATAGAPESVAAARALSDLSHMVYVPVEAATSGAGEILFLDRWTNLDGLNQFFANPQVQEQAAGLFSAREPIVWEPAAGFLGYHLPAPVGQREQVVALVHGTVRSRADAQARHNAIVTALVDQARLLGSVSHDAYFRMAAPDAPEMLEFLAVDVWMDVAGMQEHYSNPELLSAFQDMFDAPPSVSTWTDPATEWVEW